MYGPASLFARFAIVMPLIALSGGITASVASAQIREFPYEAIVVADEALVRSGAGDSYYPTQRLPRESVVTVHRHDPGGWFMIDPPEGSFSWVPERYINRITDVEGEVTTATAAFVGSEFGDEVTVFHRTLKPGERVSILGRRELDTTSGVQLMIKVAPPARERRWIPGAAVVPVDPEKRRQLNSDPYAVPGNAARPTGSITSPTQIASAASVASAVVNTPEIAPSPQLNQLQQLRREQQQLAEIDRQFREMVLQDHSTWNLDHIEASYRSLQDSATSKPVSGQIDLRYPAIERYRRRLTQLQQIRQVTSQTEQRDAALLARHGGMAAMPGPLNSLSTAGGFGGRTVASIASVGPESMTPAGSTPEIAREFEAFLAQSASPSDTSGAMASVGELQIPDESQLAMSTAEGVAGPLAADESLRAGDPRNRYIGAGIVQRASDEGSASSYVLVTPAGKVLADLKPSSGVRLEDYLGQQVGVLGSRWSEESKRDFIEVSGLEAVLIRQ